MTDDRLTPVEFAYGRGYTDALEKVAQDLHTQYHVEVEKRGSGDPRAIAFYELSTILKENASAIRKDNDSRAPLEVLTDD